MKTLVVTLAIFVLAAPMAMAERPPELKHSPATVKPGSRVTFSLPANESCAAGEHAWLLSNLFRSAVGVRTDPSGLYKGAPGFTVTIAANGGFSIQVKIKPHAHLTRGFAPVWVLCKGKRLNGEFVKIA